LCSDEVFLAQLLSLSWRGIVRIIAVMNQRRDGQTTTVVNLGFALAQEWAQTLLIDLDAQGNLGVSFGIEASEACIISSSTGWTQTRAR
jgi:cellulose biosynthesis protein BcsQ